MELFRKAAVLEAQPGEKDWTREHGYAKTSQFPFPDIYLHEKVSALAARFVNHDYGNIISMDQVENFLSRDQRKENTWMQGIYPTEKWGNIHLDIFYDLALFHLEDAAPRDLALAQRDKERAAR